MCVKIFVLLQLINPFLANVPISYPLKTLENLWFSGVFRGYEVGTLARNVLMWTKQQTSLMINFNSVMWGIMRQFVLKLNITPERTEHNA